MTRFKHRIGARCYLPLNSRTNGTQQVACLHVVRFAACTPDTRCQEKPHTLWSMLPQITLPS